MNTYLEEVKKQETRILVSSQSLRSCGRCLTLGLIVLISCAWTEGCSSPHKSAPQPSKEEIRGDADRFFKKMDQEEKTKQQIQP